MYAIRSYYVIKGYPVRQVNIKKGTITVDGDQIANEKWSTENADQLIIGGLIDRIKFSALVIFVLLWGTFVYDPIAHWVWGGGFVGGGGIDLDPELSYNFV